MSTVCSPGPAGRTGVIPEASRLDVLKTTPDCVVYHDGPLSEDREWSLSLYGNRRTGELYVELTNGGASHVRGFLSTAPEMSAEERAEGIVWPDLVEAFALARELHRAALFGGDGV